MPGGPQEDLLTYGPALYSWENKYCWSSVTEALTGTRLLISPAVYVYTSRSLLSNYFVTLLTKVAVRYQFSEKPWYQILDTIPNNLNSSAYIQIIKKCINCMSIK